MQDGYFCWFFLPSLDSVCSAHFSLSFSLSLSLSLFGALKEAISKLSDARSGRPGCSLAGLRRANHGLVVSTVAALVHRCDCATAYLISACCRSPLLLRSYRLLNLARPPRSVQATNTHRNALHMTTKYTIRCCIVPSRQVLLHRRGPPTTLSTDTRNICVVENRWGLQS
jgi:hypothetical protein